MPETSTAPTAGHVVEALTRGRFRYRNEDELHQGMMIALTAAGIPVDDSHHEVSLTAADRIDFLLAGGLGIEVKVSGQTSAVWRQLHRYATHERVSGLILVTTRTPHAVGAPVELNGKPVAVLVLRGGLR